MAHIHAAVEKKRGRSIPDWAYRDVLFMLIDYSIRSYEVLERSLSRAEKRGGFFTSSTGSVTVWECGGYLLPSTTGT